MHIRTLAHFSLNYLSRRPGTSISTLYTHSKYVYVVWGILCVIEMIIIVTFPHFVFICQFARCVLV